MKPSILATATVVLAVLAGAAGAQTISTYPDIAVDLLGPPTLQIGRADRYLLRVRNQGSAAANSTLAVVSLPAGLGLYRPTPPAGCSYNTSQRKLSCTIASLAVGSTTTLRIDLKSIGAAPSTEPVQVSASVAGEPAANTSDNTDTVMTNVGSFTPSLTFPTSQAIYLCNGNPDLLATNCLATDAVYGAHGALAFDAGGTATSAGGSFVAQQVSGTSAVVNLFTLDGRNTVVWNLTPQNATCWQGYAVRTALPGSVFYEVRMCQP